MKSEIGLLPNSPVQIILTDRHFRQAPEPEQRHPKRDFFDGADSAFASHKAALLASLKQARTEIAEQEFGPAAYLKVQMRTEAIAEGCRPVSCLFRPPQFSCVGGDEIGTLYFRALEIDLDDLIQRVNESEIVVETRIRNMGMESSKAPSSARAEVSAIDTVEIAPPAEKRQFSVTEIIHLFSDRTTVSGYLIDLFEVPERSEIADDATGCQALWESLERILLGLGPGTRVFVITEVGSMAVLDLQLTCSDAPAFVVGGFGPGSVKETPTVRPAKADLNPERHEAALNLLQAHPLVRAIRLPIQLTLAEDPDWTVK